MAATPEVVSPTPAPAPAPAGSSPPAPQRPAFVPAPAPTKNAWGVKPSAPAASAAALPAAAPSLAEVMSEQLAGDLAQKEEDDMVKTFQMVPDSATVADEVRSAAQAAGLLPEEEVTEDCKDDLLIAQMLQMQFDKEYDQGLANEEAHHNGSSKVSVSYSKYKVIPDNQVWEESEEEDAYLAMDDRKRDVDWYETADKEIGTLPKCGYRKIGENYVTKHDKQISQRKNGKRMMDFPDIATGDGGGLDVQISNPVYNEIRKFSMKENKRKHRIKDKEDKSTVSQAVDPQTRLILFKMVNNDFLSSVNGTISTGKEAVILHAEGGPGPHDDELQESKQLSLEIPAHCAVKVFKTSLNEFKTRDKYIKDDRRFRDRFGKQNPRKIVHIWAEKEMHNLMRMRRAGLAAPQPVALKKHVLVMSMVGDEDGNPSQKIKDAVLSRNDLASAYSQVVTAMKTMYHDCRLVHADLSEYNILWQAATKRAFLIDVSQSVEPGHPHALEFLMRDCRNVAAFFGDRKGVEAAVTATKLFSDITGLEIEEGLSEADVTQKIRQYEKDNRILRGMEDPGNPQMMLQAEDEDDEDFIATPDHFEYRWEKSKSGAGALASAVPIPGGLGGGRNGRRGGGGRSPKSPKSVPTASGSAKSPSGKSPSGKSPKSLAGLSDQDLKKMKEEAIKSKVDEDDKIEPHEPTQVTFKDDNLKSN